MTLFPKKFSNPNGGVYHLNDNFIQAADGSFRGTGTDGSEIGYSLFIASAATERVVSFKAFIESYKYNLQKSTEENKNSLRTKVYYTDKSSNLSISLSLNIPAHSVNESVNNVAKIEELQKLIVAGNWSYGVNVSNKTNSTVPVMLVHFRNLITNSRKVSDLSITSFDDMLAKGFTCYLKDVSYNPDTSAGFFEFDSFLYPKNLKLNLEMIYESETLLSPFDSNLDRCSIDGFTSSGEYASMEDPFDGPSAIDEPNPEKTIDGGVSPFHSYDYKNQGGEKKSMTISDMNNFDLRSSAGFSTIQKKSDSFLFIGLPSSNKENKNLSDSFSGGFDGNVLKDGKIMRHVFLESFLESHERKLTPEYQNSDSTANSSVHNILTGQVQNELSYNFKLNMVADSLIQAKQNCAKIQYMCRMFVKRYMKIPKADPATGAFNFTDVSNLCKVYSPSFVESAGSPKGGTRDVKKIFEECSIELYWASFSFDVQMDAGFFDDDGFIYPKIISVDLSFKTHEKYVAGYNYSTQDEKDPKWRPSVQNRNSARHARNSFLFPYNRKTVKI